MVEAGLNSVERFVREKFEAREWPLGAPIISPHDVLDELPYDVDRGLRNERTVEAALRAVGAKPLSEFKQLRTAKGRRRLWARNGEKVSLIFKTKSPGEVTAIYDKAARERMKLDAKEAADDLTP